MTYLCDTNIISELVKPQPNPGVIAWSAKPNPRIQTRDMRGNKIPISLGES